MGLREVGKVYLSESGDGVIINMDVDMRVWMKRFTVSKKSLLEVLRCQRGEAVLNIITDRTYPKARGSDRDSSIQH